MALEEQLTQQEQGGLTDEEEDQLSIMVNLAKNLIDEGGYQVIEQALTSKDPGQVIGQFIFQMVSQMGEQLPFSPSPKIFFAYGGFVEQISDYLQEEYDVPADVMDRAEIYIGTAAQSMAGAQQQQAQSGMPPQGAPVPAGPEGVM